MDDPSQTSYLPSFMPPLGVVWKLLMGFVRYIIYINGFDASPLDQIFDQTCCLALFPAQRGSAEEQKHTFLLFSFSFFSSFFLSDVTGESVEI